MVLAALLFLVAPSPAFPSVSQGDQIVNSATLADAGTVVAGTSVTVTAVVRTPSKIEFLKYAPAHPGAAPEKVAPTFYRTASDPSAVFVVMPPPVPAGFTTPIDLSKPVPLVLADIFHQCEPIFVRVTDPDQNLDRTGTDTVLVTLNDSATGDNEVVRLTETGPDTGVFTGYIQSAGNACQNNPFPASYNGTLPVSEASRITALYQDSVDGTDSSTAAAMVDPFGIVFNSATGNPVDGAIVTLIDTATGNPATVLGDDGVSAFPATVTSGGTASDASGRQYDFPPGGFRFPFINPGSYRLEVTTPPGYSVPSAVPDDLLQALPGGPFALVNPGSRLEPFSVNAGPALRIDIPVDPWSSALWLQKTAGKETVAVGDFLPYQLIAQNTDASATAWGVIITDRLPPGFRYRKGSTKINGAAVPDPASSPDGRTLTFAVGDLAPQATASIRYVVEVAAGASPGVATNQATARSATGTVSNLARASVQVRSDFLTSRSLIMGRVARGPCGLDWDEGVEGVRIYLEDGTFVNTDKRGMYHFEGVRPGTHVVQLDLDSLPEGFEVYSCEENSRFAGRSFSQFVDTQGGTMWRADFRVGRPDDDAIYAKRVKERIVAEELAAEKARKKEELARQAAAAAAKEEEEEEEEATEDWPAEPPAAAATGNAEEEAAADDWADPAPAPIAGDSASLQLRSALDRGMVIMTPVVEVAQAPLATGRLEVELPQGLVYHPGSVTRDGLPLADPEISGKTLAFSLGRLAAGARVSLRFAADFEGSAPSGEYISRALLTYTTESGATGRTPYADNVLVRIREEERNSLPTMVVHPQFVTFSAELTGDDRRMLDETVLMIKDLAERRLLKVRQILLTGHTDNVRIARRSRHIHLDNLALSIARALSVGRYLKEQLGLTPAQISASGKGETIPVTDNRTAAGRARNRRVEVVILADHVAERLATRVTKEESGVQRGEVAAPPSTAPIAQVEAAAPAGAQRPIPGDMAAAAPLLPDTALRSAVAGSALAAAAPKGSGAVAGSATAGPAPAPQAAPAAASLLAAASYATAAAEPGAGETADGKENKPRLEKVGILSPEDGASLPDPISAVRVVLDSKLAPRLLVDGREVPADRIGFTLQDNKAEKTLYSYIGINFGDPGVHTVTLQGKDPFGIVRFEKTATVTRVGAIAVIRLAGAEGNVADGKTPVRLRLELFDAAGVAIRAATELQILEGTLKPFREESLIPDPVQGKAERVRVDADGYALFQPVNASGLYRTVLGAGKATVEAETYVRPKMRDWILVGLGEGTVGYNAVAGHMENLQGAGIDKDLYENGRLAFYAKGTVKGEWLLTMAYDSAKNSTGSSDNSLFQTIDPNTFYTLYGDATQQQYDAASARKVYLKIERDQFYALFGDFDTGLTITELSRYSRRMNGLKAEWHGKNLEASVFGTDTAQSYARDELRGDGTSGLYGLSRRNIVINSDKITIETRDRFRSEIIIDRRTLSRFTDYSIDYGVGTLFFKEPIHSRDESFNPIFIVAEYETLDTGTESLNYGGRVGAKLFGGDLKGGFTHIHEGQVSGEGNLYGFDAAWRIGSGTVLKGELARSDTDFGGSTREGSAWLAELQHNLPKLQGRLYVREQEGGFGLGQQNGSETATRKLGGDAAYRLTDTVGLNGQLYRQYNLASGAVEDVAEGKTTWTSGPYSARLGLRYANDRLGDGSDKTSEQLTMGGSWLTLNNRLTLRADHDQSIGGNENASFPTRTTFGADFKLTEKVTLFAQQEITSGAGADTNTTSAGMKATPWEGGTVNSTMGQNLNENGERLFALFGLKQTWKITDKWSVDAGLDRSQTIRKAGDYQFNVNVPPASGEDQDFTAVSLGTTYREKKWEANSRLEVRTSDSEDKWGVLAAFVGEPKDGWGWSARCQVFDTKSATGTGTVNGDLRLGLAYRPSYSRWIILDRLDLLYDRQRGGSSASSDTESRRIVNNLSANFKPDDKLQLSLQYGAKYVLDTIDGSAFSGYTDLIGIEGRYDLTRKWDLGVRGSLLHSWSAGQIDYSAGPSVGYNIVKNAWLSLGYNVAGFTDRDFSAADYTAQGPYLRFRFKFDQNSVKEAVTWLGY